MLLKKEIQIDATLWSRLLEHAAKRQINPDTVLHIALEDHMDFRDRQQAEGNVYRDQPLKR